MSELHRTFCERVAQVAERDGRPLSVIARRAGYHPTYLQATLRGEKHNCTLQYVESIAGALGVDPLWLLGGIRPMVPELAMAKEALRQIKEIKDVGSF